MTALAARSCALHATRAASGRCAACGGDFCKECLTPHGGRLSCAACLKPALEKARRVRAPRIWTAWMGAVAGFLLLCLVYSLLGWMLARLPVQGHFSPLARDANP